MSRKFTIILISSVLGLLLLSMVGYYFIIQNNDGSTGGIAASFRSFLPFGGNDTPPPSEENPSVTATSTSNTGYNPTITNFTEKLRKISSQPIAGMGSIDTKAGTLVRYIEKATGHIYEVEMFSPKITRISNTTVPVVYDAQWGNAGNSIIARYLKNDNVTVDTYSLTLKAASTTAVETLMGIAFPGGISDVATYGNSAFYLQQSSLGSQGYVSNFEGTKKKLIWSNDIKELNSQFVNDRYVALTTKPYQNIEGYLYLVDTGTGQVRRILGNILGLSALVNKDATSVIYLEQGDSVKFGYYSITKKAYVDVSPATFPEKCIWSKKNLEIAYCAVPNKQLSNSSLTDWYMGKISTQDYLWRFDLKENTSTIISDLSLESGEWIDVIKPILSDNEQYLVFMNKIDNSLWSLDLTK